MTRLLVGTKTLAARTPVVIALAATGLACSSAEDPARRGGSAGTSAAAGTSGAGGAGGRGGTGGGPTGGSGPGGAGGTSGTSGAGGAGGTGGTSGSGGAGGTTGAGGSGGGDRSPEGVCARWNADRANLAEGTWSGNVASCDPGDISADGRANALRLYNLFRWLADLPPVTTDPERDRLAQACALLMEANETLSHNPPSSWNCWTQEGADGASSSNISGGPGVGSVDSYMIDSGNATTIGHRRWILSNSLGPIGLGSTATGASCMQNLRGEGRANKPWLAWPPGGAFPLQAVAGRRSSLDATGWTVQSDTINLAGAVVSVSSGGTNLAVTVTQLQSGYGSRYAIRFNPDGWQTEAGRTYAVNVTGIDTAINYEVAVVDCGS